MHIEHSRIQRLFKIKSELQEVYWNLVIQNFAKSLIGIFIPIYLLTLGLELYNVIAFMLFYYPTVGVFSFVSGSLTARLGYKHQILYQVPVFVLFYGLLLSMQFISFSMPLIYLTGIIGGISTCLYWVPMNSEFAKNTKKIHEGEEIATAIALPKLASIAAPTAAALILTAMGFNILFAIVIFLQLLAVIPLFATGDYRSRFKFSQERRMFLMKKQLSFRVFLSGILLLMEGIIWPLFIFITLQNLLDVGIAASVAGIGMVFFTLIIGKMSDRGKRNKLTRIGGLGYGMIWLLRIFPSTSMEIFLLSLLGGMFAAVIEITSFSRFCDIARGRRLLGWVVFREVWLSIGRVLTVLLILFVFGMDLRIGFVLAAAASFLFMFLSRK